MTKKLKLIMICIVVLVFIGTACNLPFNIDSKNKDQTSGTETDATSQPILPELSNLVQSTPDGHPVTFQEGFGSLDSYKFTLHIEMSNSNGSATIIDEQMESSVVDENNHSIMSTTEISADESEDSSSTTETYNLGTVTCTLSDGEWEYSNKTVQEKEMQDIFSEMIDFVPVLSNPVFVSEETVNGVKSNHFTFTVSGIGNKSGAVATQNQGDYWLAIDGQFIVRYTLNLKVQSAPAENTEAEISTMIVSYDLTDINVPITLSQPAECIASDN